MTDPFFLSDSGLLESYRAPKWLPGGNAQTIFPYFINLSPIISYRRERWEMDDGDFIDIDWLEGESDKPLVIMLHGLEGSSQSHYALSLMNLLQMLRWRGAVVHFRGCSGYSNRLPRAYHAGDSMEIDRMLRHIAHRNDSHEWNTPCYAVGVSLGGNALLKWLGEQGAQAARQIAGVVAVSVPLDLAAEWKEPEISSETLAFLQYTSGSTAQPKGVMVSHGNLLHNSSLIQDFFETNEDSRGVFWLPSYHDMGLVGGILQTFYCGGNVTLMSPLTFLQHPFRWLQAISRKSATVSGGPNFAYDLCVRKVTEDQKKTIDLSCWRLAFNGAEPIRHDTLKRFADAFAGCGFREEAFYPCYGLAEGTLIVSGAKLSTPPLCKAFDESSLEQHIAHEVDSSDPDSRILVSCGNIPQDQEVQIVDPDTLMALPPGRIGEIWVMGPSVAKGYWNHLEETERTFQAHIAPAGEGPFLRTGDLGFFLDGELFVTGRLKDLIIIEGRNHYPQDIEITVEAAHPAIRPAGTAVFTTEMGGHDKLTVVAEVEPKFLRGLSRSNGTNGTHKSEIDEKEVIRAIRRAVAEHHDIQVHAVALLKPGKLPKTSSGKVQRHASAAGFLAGTLDRI